MTAGLEPQNLKHRYWAACVAFPSFLICINLLLLAHIPDVDSAHDLLLALNFLALHQFFGI